MPPKRRPAKHQKLPATPIADLQRQLDEKARQLREEMERCEKFMAEAPARKKEVQRIQREEIIKARAKGVPSLTNARTTLADPRFGSDEKLRNVVRPRLRGERSQGKVMFFILLAGLIGVLAWAYTTFSGG
jgi:hypothetical protein